MIIIKKKSMLFLGLILIISGIVRIFGLTSRPIWYDEAFSMLISQKGPAAVLQATLSMATPSASAEEHPPAYYFLLWSWIQLFGNSVVAARSLSILISLGTLVLVFLLARSMFDNMTAVIATCVAGVLPFQVHYAVEIRMYGLLAFWLTLATFTFWKGTQTGQLKWWLAFAVSAALGQYTHNLAAFYLLPLAMTGLFQRNWKTVRSTFFAGIGAILLYLPWLFQIPAQFSKIQQNYWIERPGLASIFNLLMTYVSNLPLPGNLLLPGLLISVFLVVLAGYQTYLSVKQKSPHYKTGLWLCYLAFAPPIFLWLFSQWRPIYIERALLPAHVIFCIWIAWMFVHSHMPKPVILFAAGLMMAAVAMGLVSHYTYAGFPYGPFEALDNSLTQRVQPGDVIIHSNKLTYLPAFYFDQHLSQKFIIDQPGSKTDSLALATRQVLGLSEAADIGHATNGAHKIWFIVFQKELDEYKQSDGSNSPHLQYLLDNYHELSEENWGELRMYQFAN